MRPLKEVEREYIVAALELKDGNQTRTAKQLEIGSSTLYRKLKGYGLDPRQAHGIAIGVPPLVFTSDSPGSSKRNGLQEVVDSLPFALPV